MRWPPTPFNGAVSPYRSRRAALLAAALVVAPAVTGGCGPVELAFRVEELRVEAVGPLAVAEFALTASSGGHLDEVGVTVSGTDFPPLRNVATSAGEVLRYDGALRLPPGTYEGRPYVSVDGRRQPLGGGRTFTVAPPGTPPPTPPDSLLPEGPQWLPVFGDEFRGTALDERRWTAHSGKRMNGVVCRASNVSVADGTLVLTLSSEEEGAMVSSELVDGEGDPDGYTLQTGDYVEARIRFPAQGDQAADWAAWWTTGPRWPASGEHDVAESLDGELTVNYHSLSGDQARGPVPGAWAGDFHVYGLHRLADRADVYWDGELVESYPTDDDGRGHSLVLTIGHGMGSPTVVPGRLVVDWVRAWRPV